MLVDAIHVRSHGSPAERDTPDAATFDLLVAGPGLAKAVDPDVDHAVVAAEEKVRRAQDGINELLSEMRRIYAPPRRTSQVPGAADCACQIIEQGRGGVAASREGIGLGQGSPESWPDLGGQFFCRGQRKRKAGQAVAGGRQRISTNLVNTASVRKTRGLEMSGASPVVGDRPFNFNIGASEPVPAKAEEFLGPTARSNRRPAAAHPPSRRPQARAQHSRPRQRKARPAALRRRPDEAARCPQN
jgi:hypothetical protein